VWARKIQAEFEDLGFTVTLAALPAGKLRPYQGLLAAGARWRSMVVRDRRPSKSRTAASASSLSPPKMPGREFFRFRQRRLSWSDLMPWASGARATDRTRSASVGRLHIVLASPTTPPPATSRNEERQDHDSLLKLPNCQVGDRSSRTRSLASSRRPAEQHRGGSPQWRQSRPAAILHACVK